MLSLQATPTKKAVAYFRHSAEDKQENSVSIQREHIQKFAQKFGIEIIHEEADEGKSGLSADRPGFHNLFQNWVFNSGAPHFDYILVYDVSRWGRFQDPDEAGHYVHICKKHGKQVIYVDRGVLEIDDQNQLLQHILTPTERFMAAHYSKQLSSKVFYGSVRVSQQGYSAGGTAPYGLARLLLDVNKKPVRVLKHGEHKSIDNERVTFVPLHDDRTKAVKEAFNRLVNQWEDPADIAGALNAKGFRSANGGLWNREKILRILTNEAYAGTRIYNKTWGRLKQPGRRNPRSEWVITPNAFEPIVSPELFAQAQEHLYWLLPSKWQKGLRVLNTVKTFIKAEIQQSLIKQVGVTEEKILALSRNLPVIFSISFYSESVPNWCFLVNENTRKYDNVLGVSVVLDKKNPIDRYFLFPTNDFPVGDFLLLSERDAQFSSYSIPAERIHETIDNLVGSLVNKKQRAQVAS